MKMASYYIIVYILVCFFHISSAIAQYNQYDNTCPSYSQITWSSKGEIELIPNVPSVGECFKLCISNVDCVGHTWYGNIEE